MLATKQEKNIQSLITEVSINTLEGLPSLDRYLYSGLTIEEILKQYIKDLRLYGQRHNNRLELFHAAFLERYLGIITNDLFIDEIQDDLENHFLAEIRRKYPQLSFALRGRIKALIRLELKWNSYVQFFIIDYIKEHGRNPTVSQICKHLERYRDVIAYRFILQSKNYNHVMELESLASIANEVPKYFNTASMDEESLGGYTPIKASRLLESVTTNPSMLDSNVRIYFKDYVSNPKEFGFRAYTICMRHNKSGHVFELQLETFDMLKRNEHGPCPHDTYEKTQNERRRNAKLPKNCTNRFFEEAHERIIRLLNVKRQRIHVNMFFAFSQTEFEDLCGLYVGRQATPREFL